jgi:hypothetical protein
MPAYFQSTAGNPISCLYPGGSADVFSAESVATGEQSQALALSNYPQGGATPLSVDIFFSAPPGAFTFNVVFAAKDIESHYSMPDTTYQLTDANLDENNNSVHFDAPFTNARFVAIYVELQPANPVNVTATIKR